MDLSTARQIGIDQRYERRGTSMTAMVPNGEPFALYVVWDGTDLEGAERNRQLQRSLWVKRDDLPTVPRGTLFCGPEPQGGDDRNWRADQTLAIESGQIQVLVTEVKL